MRVRFFLIILILLSLVSTVSIVLNAYQVRSERRQLIDQQVRETAINLLDSELSTIRQVDLDRADKIISAELGESRFDKFFVIRNQAGDVLFKSENAHWLEEIGLDRGPQWLTITRNGKYVRVLNLALPSIDDRTLQVGLIIDEQFVSLPLVSKGSLIFFVVILFFGFAIAWISTAILLRPVTELSRFVTLAAEKTSVSLRVPEPPESLSRGASVLGWSIFDEFSRLIVGLGELIQKINRNYKVSRFWTYQLAHELKTPLSLLSVEIENAEISGQIRENLGSTLKCEITRATNVVSSFLNWAELEHSNPQKMLYANRLSKVLGDIQMRLRGKYGDRLQMDLKEDLEVLAHPVHLEHLCLNLISNALAYTQASVIVTIQNRRLSIRDFGPGIPNMVLARLGEPFNRGPNSGGDGSGHGLGLAWAASVAKLYGWKFEIVACETPPGTEIQLEFPAH